MDRRPPLTLSDAIDYPQRLENALLWMVGDLLREVASGGLPGEHHFYVTFHTDAPGVMIPAVLADTYPEEMTIVIQHRFWDLEVDDDGFAITLAFDGRKHRLEIPFPALRAFLDPSVSFGLRFGSPGDGQAAIEEGGADPGAEEGSAVAEGEEPAADAAAEEANVLSFERFRKR